MQIIQHGLGTKVGKENPRQIFEECLKADIPFETDIRNDGTKIVLSHSLPTGSEMCLEELLEMRQSINPKSTLALHFNANGLGQTVDSLLKKYNQDTDNLFCFGNPTNDLNACLKYYPDLPMYTVGCDLYSEGEDYKWQAPLSDKSKGIWLDSFTGNYDFNFIQKHLNEGKKICFASDDLFKRDNTNLWSNIVSNGLIFNDNVKLCTNNYKEAEDYFNEAKCKIIQKQNERGK